MCKADLAIVTVSHESALIGQFHNILAAAKASKATTMGNDLHHIPQSACISDTRDYQGYDLQHSYRSLGGRSSSRPRLYMFQVHAMSDPPIREKLQTMTGSPKMVAVPQYVAEPSRDKPKRFWNSVA